VNKDVWIETHEALDKHSISHYLKRVDGDAYLIVKHTQKFDAPTARLLDGLGWEVHRFVDDGVEFTYRRE
jgi:hypothetical protein